MEIPKTSKSFDEVLFDAMDSCEIVQQFGKRVFLNVDFEDKNENNDVFFVRNDEVKSETIIL